MGVDDLDLDSLRLPQNFGEMLGVRKSRLSIPLRKPHKQEFFRVHPSAAWTFPAAILKLQGDRRDDLYVVSPAIGQELPEYVTPVVFVAMITRQDVFALWPLRMPDPTGRVDEYARTAQAAAELARTKWIRLVAKQALGAYEVLEPLGVFPEPTWPEEPFGTLCQRAFRDRVIEDLSHPVLRQLRGEV